MKVHVENYNGFDISFEAMPEHCSISSSFDDSMENIQKLIDDVNNYRAEWFIAKVSASKNGIELSTEYLGGCYYESAKDFYTKYKGDYYSDMREQVIKEAKEVVNKLLSE